jgi:16S rRNA (uracil1498-N3)-methyltransferase
MSVRVFHRSSMQPSDVITLEAAESHYLVRVRRARPGTQLEILDGTALAFAGEVVDADAKAATIRIGEPIIYPAVAPIEIAIGLPDPSATLDAVARACELGAARVVLVRCEHGQTTAPGRERMRRVLEAAQRQCGRPDLPTIEGPLPLDQWLERRAPEAGFVASMALRGGSTAIDPAGPAGARVLVGPEGGLTDGEIELATRHGLRPISLGPWTLRTEVAVVAALGLVLHGSGHGHGHGHGHGAGRGDAG